MTTDSMLVRPARRPARRPPRRRTTTVTAAARGGRAACDGAESALHAAAGSLPARELGDRGRRLSAERDATIHLLDEAARAAGESDRFAHLLVPRSRLREL